MLLRYLIGVVFIMHGLAHMSGVAAAFTSGNTGFSGKPWLFSAGVKLRSPIGKLFGLVWLAAAVTLVGSGLSLLFRWGTWPALPIAGSILSLLAIVPWWNTVVPGAKAGAALDALTLIALVAPWSAQIMAALGVQGR
jgi:hypothetical protein